MHRYDYGRPWAIAQRFRALTREQLVGFFDEYIAPGSANRRRLSTHVFSASSAPATLIRARLEDDFYPPWPTAAAVLDLEELDEPSGKA